MQVKCISAAEVHQRVIAASELAFLDVREHGVHSQGHPLYAVPLPLSRLELEVERLVPKKSVPIVLLDQGEADDYASRAAKKFIEFGYEDISILEGGVMAWKDAGFELFSGVNVPSKAFGEFVEQTCETPHITAAELNDRLSVGEKIAIFDSRPYSEYQRMCIPGGVDMPGAELAYRIHENIADDTTPIVVNCAGRTRSIIGAQSLINAGVKNPVMALKDGTMGWYLEGFSLEHGSNRVAGPPSMEAHEKSLQGARALAEKLGVKVVEKARVDRLKDSDCALFLLDVRTIEEFEERHVAGAQHAPGGQLVQATDEYVGVRGATLVLFDDKEVRALMTASWLKQLGWRKVFVVTDFSGFDLETGPMKKIEVAGVETLTPHELSAVLQSGEAVALLDLSPSLSFRAGHIPRANWMIRSRIPRDMMLLPPVGLVILTAEDERIAHLAAPEIQAVRPEVIVRVLAGGNKAWKEAGLNLEEGETGQLSPPEDAWYKPYDNKEKIRERMLEYLEWEVGLISQIERDATANFNILS
ncbi:rhodanese-like domain-containing protein [Sneathiella limimaris]|uniref:rhodanese-like domain-containing protein n=1 Tax=Sneathiella limimaris TaxID=1964213 RepID=UPI00146C4BD8|nr:rhodanese-like domain-containing protein [Sneathiella limimaris]